MHFNNKSTKNITLYDIGKKFLYTVEIDGFKNTIFDITALNRSIKKTKSTIEMEFLLTKELWDDFKNIKDGRRLTICAITAKNNPIAVEQFEVYDPELILGNLEVHSSDDVSLTFKVIFNNFISL